MRICNKHLTWRVWAFGNDDFPCYAICRKLHYHDMHRQCLQTIYPTYYTNTTEGEGEYEPYFPPQGKYLGRIWPISLTLEVILTNQNQFHFIYKVILLHHCTGLCRSFDSPHDHSNWGLIIQWREELHYHTKHMCLHEHSLYLLHVQCNQAREQTFLNCLNFSFSDL